MAYTVHEILNQKNLNENATIIVSYNNFTRKKPINFDIVLISAKTFFRADSRL